MKKRICCLILSSFLCLSLLLSGCGASKSPYYITMEEAVKLMSSEEDYLIVDVRTKEEYDTEHIKGAVLLPIEKLREGNVDPLPDKDQLLLIYCRTGRRAEDAAAILKDMGYTHVHDFGGIVEWEGETEASS